MKWQLSQLSEKSLELLSDSTESINTLMSTTNSYENMFLLDTVNKLLDMLELEKESHLVSQFTRQ